MTTNSLNSNHRHQLLHRCGALIQRGLFFWRELDLDNLFQPLGAELARHPNI